jgi:catechol 2,3-dioxygenase-like lactoylglutathione lyase family enzyme
MADVPRLTLTTINVGAPDPAALARFYQKVLGWKITDEEDGFLILRPADGGVGLSFQREVDYVRPTWPAGPGDQQMMVHLEIAVDELAASAAFAVECGASLAEYQPQADVRVCIDPAGHPFCLYLEHPEDFEA